MHASTALVAGLTVPYPPPTPLTTFPPSGFLPYFSVSLCRSHNAPSNDKLRVGSYGDDVARCILAPPTPLPFSSGHVESETLSHRFRCHRRVEYAAYQHPYVSARNLTARGHSRYKTYKTYSGF